MTANSIFNGVFRKYFLFCRELGTGLRFAEINLFSGKPNESIYFCVSDAAPVRIRANLQKKSFPLQCGKPKF